MNGSDHLMPQPWLGRMVAEANDLQDDFDFEITSLPRYLAGAPTEGLTRVEGELRSGARANMLMGVTSNRVDVKRRGAVAERELERRAEPLAALFQAPADYPDRLLELAWLEMVRNSAHDSVCACSVDDVVDAVLHRYAEARAIAAGLADRAVRTFARSLSQAGPSVLNPSPRARSGVVELVVPADGPPPTDVQVLSERSGLPGSMVLDADTVRTVLGMLQGPRISDDAWIHDVRIEDTEDGIDITIAVGTEEKPDVPIVEAKQDVYTRLGARPDAVVRVAMDQPSTRRIAARSGEVPGYGWSDFAATPLTHRVEVGRDRRRGRGAPTGWSASTSTTPTAPSRWTAHPATAAWSTAATSATRTTTRPRARTPSWTHPTSSPSGSMSAVRSGRGCASRAPTSGRITLTVPRRHAVGSHQVDVDTVVEVRADEATVRVTTTFVNPSGDHRLRVNLPLPEPADAVAGRERLHRRHAGLVRRGPARRVRPPHRAGQPFRQRRAPHGGPRRRVRVRARRHRGRRGAHHRPHRAALDRHAVPPRHGLPPLPGGPAHAGGGPADAGQAGGAALRAGARLRRPLPAGRRRPAATRARPEPGRWRAPGLGQRS